MGSDIDKGFVHDFGDLSQLSIASAETVQNAMRSLQPSQGSKNIIVIGTGGTLSMKEENGIRTPDLDVSSILSHLDPAIARDFTLTGIDAFHIDSAQIDYRHIRDMAIIMCYLWHHTPVDIAGFLILHGTDTLAFSGSALSLMMGQGLPFSIVITAAQKPIHRPFSDAAQNVTHAIYTLDALHDQNMAEVVSVMGDYAYLSSSAVKVHDANANALTAPMHLPVTDFTQLSYPLQLADWLKPRRANTAFKPTIWHGQFGHSLIVQSHVGLSPDMIAQQIKSDHVKAVLLYSYGAGTIYDGIIDCVMREAAAKKCPVFIVSPLHSSYKIIYASARDLIDRGAISLHMTLPAALAKIEIALRWHEDDHAAMVKFMQTNYVGEIPPNA